MKKIVSPIEVRDRLGQIIEEAYYSGKQFIIARRGKPMAAIIPISEYVKWEQERDEFFRLVDKTWQANQDIDQEKLNKDIMTSIQEVREK
jgi:prevent-host-death family protein